jgi:hypothetical protein
LGYIVAIPVTGNLILADGRPEEAVVRLKIHTAHAEPIELTTQPDETGFFIFNLDLNPDNIPLPSVGERFFDYSVHCPDCHFSSEAVLPVGQLRLEITAVHPQQGQKTAVREVTVDRSGRAALPVQVVLVNDSGFGLAQIPVYAETRLYEWRGRIVHDTTDAAGYVTLDVEALGQRETHYYVSVPPTMINDRRYSSIRTEEVIIPAGATQVDPITLAVRIENGIIIGRVQTMPGGTPDLAGSTALAFAQPSGRIYTQPLAADGTFLFEGLPMGEYLLTMETAAQSQEWAARTTHLDLSKQPTTKATLEIIEKTAVQGGHLRDEDGYAIPFAWLADPERGYVSSASPLDGAFTVAAAEDETAVLQVTAPGFWSQTVRLDNGAEEITLQPRPDRRSLEWGSGQVYLPAESVIVHTEEDTLSLVRGWLWGHNEQPETLSIDLEGANLTLEAGEFALEVAPGETSWLYLNDGQAIYTSREGVTRQVAGGQMLAFGDGVPDAHPVTADERVVALFRETRRPTANLPYAPAPTAAQQLNQQLGRMGQGLGQFVVGATYLLIILAPLAALLFGVRRLMQARR